MRRRWPAPDIGFVWGAATSAFQIEGGRDDRGRRDSIWDRFADAGHVPGFELLGCDSFHRWEEDLDLLAGLGVGGYRFSVSWPRVIPDGDEAINADGLAFYRRFALSPAEDFVEPHPGGGAVGVRLHRYDKLTELIGTLKARGRQ